MWQWVSLSKRLCENVVIPPWRNTPSTLIIHSHVLSQLHSSVYGAALLRSAVRDRTFTPCLVATFLVRGGRRGCPRSRGNVLSADTGVEHTQLELDLSAVGGASRRVCFLMRFCGLFVPLWGRCGVSSAFQTLVLVRTIVAWKETRLCEVLVKWQIDDVGYCDRTGS